MSTVSSPAPKTETLNDEQRADLLTAEIEKNEKLAASQIEMAKLFLAQGKTDIARRRLEQILAEWPTAEAARSAQQMLLEL